MQRAQKQYLYGILIATVLSGAPIELVRSATAIPASNMLGCEALTNATLNKARILRAYIVNPPFVARWDEVPSAKENVMTPFCRIEGKGQSAPASDILFEVWLPISANWNGRLLGVGASRSLGSVNTLDLGLGVNRGYAAVATDNGHHGFDATDISWALGHPERIADFGYRAHHLAVQSAKALIKRFYGHSERHAYYFGCSQGGFTGMLAAQRYPADYDGIVAGSPVYSWTAEMTSQAWNYRALTATAAAAISIPQMQALYAAAQRQCGGPDGLIADPRQCNFDPSTLRCPAAGAVCLTPDQLNTVRKMYDGPRKSSGEMLGRGLTHGSESTWPRLWDVSTAQPTSGGSWLGTYRNMVFDNPRWDPVTLNFDRDPDLARHKVGALLDADNANLDEFRKRGGKLLVYHGWADHMVPAESSTDYYAAVVARMGFASVDTFFRLFMLPGMAHCAGGPGAGEILNSTGTPEVPLKPDHDVLAAVTDWVENGRAPARLIALKADDSGHVERSRLVCPEPRHARFRGIGTPFDASSWKCESHGRESH
jgi:feruloyl esterase